MRSTTSYACEVWVDSKKIEAIEVMYQGFLKSLFKVRKTTSTSIMLAKFGKFPFEHFAWGQALLYYNRVSTITKDCILGKAWEAQLTMHATGKKIWAEFVKKWLLQNQPREVQVLCLRFNHRWKRRFSLQRPVHSNRELLNRHWEWFLKQCTYIRFV